MIICADACIGFARAAADLPFGWADKMEVFAGRIANGAFSNLEDDASKLNAAEPEQHHINYVVDWGSGGWFI